MTNDELAAQANITTFVIHHSHSISLGARRFAPLNGGDE
jgi:hypothetical protein